MSKKINFEFNDYIIAIDEPYENDCGYVSIGKKQSNGINIVFKSPNKGTVNWFIELQKYITDLQSQLDQANERLKGAIVPRFKYGDKVYYIRFFWGEWRVFNQRYVAENRSNIIVKTMNYYNELPKDSVFATEQEAQAKLKEIQGEIT